MELQEISFKHKQKLFNCEGDETLQEVSPRSCVISVHGHTENPSGHDSKKLAICDPYLTTGLGLDSF